MIVLLLFVCFVLIFLSFLCFQGGYAAYRYTQPATATAYSDRYEFIHTCSVA